MAEILTNAGDMNQQDDMEMSSEAGQADIDFDIDFEPVEEATDFLNEDAMQDDSVAGYDQDIELRSATDNNDYMIDDLAQEPVTDLQDGLMLDVLPQNQMDEELLDLSDDEAPRESHDTQGQDAEDSFTYLNAPEGIVDLTDTSNQDSYEEHVDVHPTSLPLNVADDEQDQPQDTKGGPLADGHDAEATETGGSEVGGNLRHTDLVDGTTDGGKQAEGQAALKQAGTPEPFGKSQPPVNDEDSQAAVAQVAVSERSPAIPNDEDSHGAQIGLAGLVESKAEDRGAHDSEHDAEESEQHGEPSNDEHSDEHHTFTGLHPTLVKYDGGQYSLFPSSEPTNGEEYFLEDENLVNGSIGDLLQACRGVLGESISEDVYLELQAEELELFVSEDSTAAFSTSFSELLDIFVLLHRNEGAEHVPPMTVALTTKPRFTNRLTLLVNAAAEGKGISQFAAAHGHEQNDDSEQHGYHEHEVSHYQDAVESYEATENAEVVTDTQQDGSEMAAFVLDAGNDAFAEGDELPVGSHSKDSLANFDYGGHVPDDETSHTASRDEQDGTYIQGDVINNDDPFELVGSFTGEYGDEEPNAEEKAREGHLDGAGVDSQHEGDAEGSGTLNSNAHENEPEEDGLMPASTQIAEKEKQGITEGPGLVVTSTSGQPSQAASHEDMPNEHDEIDFEDDLDDVDGLGGADEENNVADNGASQVKTKRSLDEVEESSDQEAKRHRPL